MIIALPLRKEEARYTYADYLTWDDDERWEIIEGVPYLMSPAPSTDHQGVCGELFRQIANFLLGKPCRVFIAPFDVRLFPKDDESDDTVVQPDIVVVFDRSKLSRRGCAGASDMLIEILSPTSIRRDMFEKLQLYKKAGVREYWTVNPEAKTVWVMILKDGEYAVTAYGDDGSVPVHVLEGLNVDLAEVFADVE